jgi:ADP-ribosylglycohydrolase
MGDDEGPKAIPARVAAALKGAIVADAATMGTHWIYDLEELKATVTSVDAPEFKDPPSPKFYSAEEFPGHYGPGMLSPTGEQLLFFAEYCGKHKCVTAGHLSVQFKQWAETWGGRKDSATKEFLQCMKAADRSVELIGEEDKQGTYF